MSGVEKGAYGGQHGRGEMTRGVIADAASAEPSGIVALWTLAIQGES